MKEVELTIAREKEKNMVKNQHVTINSKICANQYWKDTFRITGHSAEI